MYRKVGSLPSTGRAHPLPSENKKERKKEKEKKRRGGKGTRFLRVNKSVQIKDAAENCAVPGPFACSGSFIAREIHRAQAEARAHRPAHPSRVLEPEDDFMQILIFPTKAEEKKGKGKKKTLMDPFSDASTYRAQSVNWS